MSGKENQHGEERKDKIYYKGYFKIIHYRRIPEIGSALYGKNPVMFVVDIGFLITLLLTIFPTLFGGSAEYRVYNGIVTAILFVTVLFANFAESVAEGRGKAQAAS